MNKGDWELYQDPNRELPAALWWYNHVTEDWHYASEAGEPGLDEVLMKFLWSLERQILDNYIKVMKPWYLLTLSYHLHPTFLALR